MVKRWFDESLVNGGQYEKEDLAVYYSQKASALELLEKYGVREYERVMDERYELFYDRKILAGIFRRAGKKFSGYAVSLYTCFMEQGDKDAVLALAEMYAEDGTVSKISGKTVEKLKKIAASGDAKAQYIAASVIRKLFPGETGEAKYSECIGIAEDTALFGWSVYKDIRSAEVLGLINETYYKDLQTAEELYKQVAMPVNGERPISLYRLLRLYLDKDGDLFDTGSALAYLERGLWTGSPDICLIIADAYDKKLFGFDKMFEAPVMYLRAAEHISPEAQYRLAEFLSDRYFCDEAKEWANRLINTGASCSDELLGMRYARLIMDKRRNIKKEIGKAEALFAAAAAAGFTEVYESLAEISAITGNVLGALYWYCLAYKNGSKDCKEKINDILNAEKQHLMKKSTDPPECGDTVTSAPRAAIEKVGEDNPGAVGYLLFDNITGIKYYGIITLIYHAFLCGAAKVLKTSGYKTAADKLAEATLADKADIVAALFCIAEAYGLKTTIPINNVPITENSADIGRLRDELTSGDEPDLEKIIGVFGEMSDSVCGRAAYLLGRYYDCDNPAHDTAWALGYFRHGEEMGDPDCTAFVGKYLLEGTGLEKNGTAAVCHIAKAFAADPDIGGYFIEMCAGSINEELRQETVEALEKSGAGKNNPHYIEMLKNRDAADAGAWKGINNIIRDAELSEYGSPERLKLYRIASLHGYPAAMNEQTLSSAVF